MDILACPICKNFPLKLIVFSETSIPPVQNTRRCELYCEFHGGYVKEVLERRGDTDCPTCYTKEIVDAILICSKCGRWYPVEEEIPRMLPDELRDKDQDTNFLKKWKERIPSDIIKDGKPFSLG